MPLARAMSLDADDTEGASGEGADQYREMQVLSFALVEKRDGTQFVDASSLDDRAACWRGRSETVLHWIGLRTT